ncbi:MAG: hypothetical protein ACQSGP_00325 [Frankia sp.]
MIFSVASVGVGFDAPAGTVEHTRRWRRLRATTTPGLLRKCSVGLAVAVAMLWGVSLATITARHDAIQGMRHDSGPSFVAAQRIHDALSEADATVAGAFLVGGVEPATLRAAYDRSIATATQQLVDLDRTGVPARLRGPLTILSGQIPVYTGLVERARANNRSGFVIGAAYLRKASGLMQNTILPAADQLAAFDADRIHAGYMSATRWYHPALVIVFGGLALAGLVAVQVLLSRRTHRILNVPLVAATVLVTVSSLLILTAFAAERATLRDGRDHGFVPMTVVAQARVLALRAWADQSLSLIARGDGAVFDTDADATAARLNQVLAAGSALGGPDASTRAGLTASWRDYESTSGRVRRSASDVGGFQDAVALALGDGTPRFHRFDQQADTAVTASQRRFSARLSSADSVLGSLAVGTAVALALAALLVLAGLQLRINEYR